MSDEIRRCWLCGANGSKDPLEEHHIFGGPNRALSDKYGLTVYLCGNKCHRNGPFAAHRNAETMKTIRQYGQRKAMYEQNWTVEDFVKVFGRNYIDD